MRLISTNESITRKQTYLEELEMRLHHGDHLIRQLEAENKPVDHLVQHWLTLLHEYEAECRETLTAA